MDILKQIEPPHEQNDLKINRHARWFTWSTDARKLFRSLGAELESHEAPKVNHVADGRPYGATYSLPLSLSSSATFAANVRDFARQLLALEATDSLIFLSGLLEDVDFDSLARSLAVLRDAMTELLQDPFGASHGPLGITGLDAGDLLFHADRDADGTLFNVFDDSPTGASGFSIFLPLATVLSALEGIQSVPDTERQFLISRLTGTGRHDVLRDLCGPLQQHKPEWAKQLATEIAPKTLRIKLARGQGYLIQNRKWLHGLHGCDAPTGGAPPQGREQLTFSTLFHHRVRRPSVESTECDQRFYVRESTIPDAGQGLFARVPLKHGDRLRIVGAWISANSLSDQCTHYADEYKIRVGNHLLIPSGWGALVNHSDEPNVAKVVDDEEVHMQTLRPVGQDEELLYRYSEYAQRRFGPFSKLAIP